MLSITSDYFDDLSHPQPFLQRIAETGFSHVHWCHHWDDMYVYAPPEIDEISGWFKTYNLRLLNLHSTDGGITHWNSPVEEQRHAGLALVINRIEMTAALGADVTILHFLRKTDLDLIAMPYLDLMCRSLDALEPLARRLGVRLAIENGWDDTFEEMNILFSHYAPDFLGLCYDSGHGNLGKRQGLDHLEYLKDRLIAVHLHDNDGSDDQHRVPLQGNIDWQRLARILASSNYTKTINLEAIMYYPDYPGEREFLQAAYQAATRLDQMVRSLIKM
jgi:sugar phosphate isomerase/epimerase